MLSTVSALLGIAVLCVQLWNEIQKARLIALEMKKKQEELQALRKNNFGFGTGTVIDAA